MKLSDQTNYILSLLSEFKENHGIEYGIIEFGIFGSLARGEAYENSDVDIWVITETPNPYNIVRLKQKLEELIGRNVDIVRIWEKMNPYLKEIISKEGLNVC